MFKYKMNTTILLITIIIIIVFIATIKNHLDDNMLRMVIIAVTASWVTTLTYNESETENFWDLPYLHGLKPFMDGKVYDSDLPDDIHDIYQYENTIAANKLRNKDAYPEETDRCGPRLGAPWAIDNSDVVDNVISYSRGLYDYDPNYEAIDSDDLLAKKQEHRAQINKKAIDGRVKSTREIYDKYFAAEFDEEESHEWWGNNDQVTSEIFPY